MNQRELRYLVLILLIFFAACIETDIYLPAFADMMSYFSADEAAIQRILSWNFFALCVAGLFYGPLSDYVGRKGPLMIALAFFLLGSLLTVVSPSFNVLLAGRVLQGLGCGGVFALGTAIIFDAFRAEKALIALNRCNMIVPFLLASAPMLGGFLNQHFGFRANFLAIGLAVLLSFLGCLLFFEETLPQNKRRTFELRRLLHDFQQVLRCLPFWRLSLQISLLWACYLAFLSGIAVLFVVDLGVTKTAFPFYQGSLLLAYLVASLSLGRASQRGINVRRLGLGLVLIGACGLTLATAVARNNALALTVVMLPFVFGFVWLQTSYCSEVMELLPDIKGISSSLLTSLRTLSIALIISLAAYFYNGTIVPVTAIIVTSSALIAFLFA